MTVTAQTLQEIQERMTEEMGFQTFPEKEKERKWTCIAPIVSISTTKRSDVDHTELPANTPHLPFHRIRIR